MGELDPILINFLKLDGSNANQNIDIGAWDFITTGDIFASDVTLTGSLEVGSTLSVVGSITGVNVTSGADPGHTHTGASVSGIDISADTNLAVTTPIVLTDDTLSFDYAVTIAFAVAL